MSFQKLPTFLRKSLLTAALLFGIANAAFAQTYYTAAVSSYNNYPFNGTTSAGNMCQFLYFPSDFNTTPPGAYNITTVYFKAATTGSTTYTNLTIKLANTTLTSLTSGTWNSGLTTAYYSASVSSSWTSGTWTAISLSTPFFYTGGNLLVEASQTGITGTGMGVWYFSGSVNKRLYGTTTSASSTGADVSPLSFGFDAIPAACNGMPTPDTVKTAAMSPAAPICSGGTKTLNSSTANLGTGFAYQWQSSSSATGPWTNVTSGSGATTTTYTTGALTTNTYFRIATICTNTTVNNTAYSQPYLVLVGTAQPGAITGNALFCPGDTATYAVPNVSGTTYAWTLPSGWTYIYNNSPNTNSILVTPTGTSGTISVTATSSCGPTSVPQTKSIVPGVAPASPGSISGPAFACPNSAQTYTVTAVSGATSYQWTLPSGWSGTSNTSTITVTTGTTGGSLQVKAVNGCGQSASISYTVGIVTSLANPGAITGSTSVCSGQQYGYSINPVPAATSYVWILPSGWSGTTSGTSIQVFPGTTGGTLTVTAYSSCATSPTSSLAVTSNATAVPSVTIARGTLTQCSGKNNTYTATPTNGGPMPTYQWQKNGMNIASTNTPSYTDNSLVTGDRINVILTSNATCAIPGTATSRVDTATVTTTLTPGININSNPPIIICTGASVKFITNITGGGTAPHYQWYKNGAPLMADTLSSYTTSALADRDSLTVVLTSSAPCTSMSTATSNRVGVTVNPYIIPSVSVSASSNVALPGVDITFTATQSGGGTNPDYQWLKNGVEIPFATSATYTANDLMPGDEISVKMLSHDACPLPKQVTSNFVKLKGDPLSVAGLGNWEGALSIYPNPTTGRFTIAASWAAAHTGKRVSIDVINALGQSVYHSEVTPGGTNWHVDVTLGSALANGRYMLRVSGDGMKSTAPFVLSH